MSQAGGGEAGYTCPPGLLSRHGCHGAVTGPSLGPGCPYGSPFPIGQRGRQGRRRTRRARRPCGCLPSSCLCWVGITSAAALDFDTYLRMLLAQEHVSLPPDSDEQTVGVTLQSRGLRRRVWLRRCGGADMPSGSAESLAVLISSSPSLPLFLLLCCANIGHKRGQRGRIASWGLFSSHDACVLTPAPPPGGCLSSGKFRNFSVPQYP